MTPFVVALFIWFALSIPVTLVLGRLLADARGKSAMRTSRPQDRGPAQRLVRTW